MDFFYLIVRTILLPALLRCSTYIKGFLEMWEDLNRTLLLQSHLKMCCRGYWGRSIWKFYENLCEMTAVWLFYSILEFQVDFTLLKIKSSALGLFQDCSLIPFRYHERIYKKNSWRVLQHLALNVLNLPQFLQFSRVSSVQKSVIYSMIRFPLILQP